MNQTTPEPRIKRLSLDESRAAAEAVGIAPQFAELNVFRVLLHQPKLAKAISEMLVTLLFRGKLAHRLRELVILRIGWVTASEYEWTQHWRVALELGVPEADALAVRDWRSNDSLGPADRAVLAATDETLETGAISAETWAECERHVGGPQELLDLVASIGNWRLFSQLLQSLEIPLEDGVAGWPPDGRIPAPPAP
jgi:alkylhydroperoxidase family enzyme